MPGVIFSIFYLGQVRTRLVGMKVRTFGLLSLFRVVVTLACLVWALMYPWANETITWSEISGALSKPKRLLLEKDIEGSYKCPVPECHHEGFTTQRGCRKHVKVKHQWFIYFNEKPKLENSPEKEELPTEVLNESRSDTSSLPTFPTSCEIGEQFNKWLTARLIKFSAEFSSFSSFVVRTKKNCPMKLWILVSPLQLFSFDLLM